MMAELQEQLQAILGDPQAMSQITAIARALTGSPAQEPQPHARDVDFVPVETPAPEEGQPPSPPQAPDLSALLGGGGADVDPRLLQIALQVFSEYSAQDDRKTALLTALKPFLKDERLEKMEKAEKLARLSRAVRTAIRLLKEGDGDV